MNRQLVLTLVLVAFAPIAYAQDKHPVVDSKWWFTAGVFLADSELEGTATVTGVAPKDFGGNLGLEESNNLFMLELGWQFGEKWGVALQYFDNQRNGSAVLDESFDWQGAVYDVDASVNASTGMEVTRIFFAREFIESGSHRLRAGLGLHRIDIEATISGEASIDGGQTTGFRRSRASATLPIPDIGVWYQYSASDRWLLNARIDWLSASYDKFSGDIWNVSAGANFSFTDHFGIGLSYQYFHVGGGIKENNWRGSIETTYSGPYLYLSGYW